MFKRLFRFAQHPSSRTVAFAFLAMSLLFGSWIARIPEIQENLELSEGALGLCLLSVSVGALTNTLLYHRLSQSLSGGQATFWGILGLCLFVPTIAFASSVLFLIPAFFLTGFFNTFLDIAMNDCANAIEQTEQVHILSTCHGIFSLGAMLGAASSGLMSTWGVAFSWHLSSLGLLLAAIAFYLRHPILQLPTMSAEPIPWSWPPPALWGLAIIGFCIMLGEGAIADWSTIYLKNNLQQTALVASLGFAAFSLMMTIGRFSGDQWRLRFSSRQLIGGGSLLGAAGLLLAVLLPHPLLVILGFALVGLGFSCIVPLLFSASSKIAGVDPSKGVTTVAGSGIIGFLLGPPLIGFVAESFGLSVSFALVAFLALLSFGLALQQRSFR